MQSEYSCSSYSANAILLGLCGPWRYFSLTPGCLLFSQWCLVYKWLLVGLLVMGTKIRNNFGHNLEDIIVLSFYFLDGVFWNLFLILMMSNFSNFFLLLLALLMLYLRNHCLIHGHNDLCLKPTLRFLIHFGLILHITYSTILTSFFGM